MGSRVAVVDVVEIADLDRNVGAPFAVHLLRRSSCERACVDLRDYRIPEVDPPRTEENFF